MEKLLVSWARVNVNTASVHARVGPPRRKGSGLYSLRGSCNCKIRQAKGTETEEGYNEQREHECERRAPQDQRPSAARCCCTRSTAWLLARPRVFSSSNPLPIPQAFIRRVHKYPVDYSVYTKKSERTAIPAVFPRGRPSCTCISTWPK